MEVSVLNLIVSIIFVAFTYALFAWGFWIGYKAITTDHEAHVDFGHAYGAPGTFDPIYQPADTTATTEDETIELPKAA